MYFPSKKDTWLAIIVWGLTFLIGWQMIIYNSVIGYIISSLIIGMLLWLWFGTGYKIEEGRIKIKYGPFSSIVKIDQITRMKATKSPLSAPALSIDRIEILHGKYNSAIISPKDVDNFIKILLTKNQDIQIENDLINNQSD
ncbi:PH domain-containing protein [Paucisalibacillus globulus]|uniref:PH domain-containing protein n=1 Tax=Paucisalibacillus globulus TaxID=351095 RepID=UPI00047C0A8C|nr:PH domain-containing protein [Paucisalibacillus globulus]